MTLACANDSSYLDLRRYGCMGDPINLASRLEGSSDQVDIGLGCRVYRCVEGVNR